MRINIPVGECPEDIRLFLVPSHAIDTLTRFTKTLRAIITTTTLMTITTALNILNQLVFVLRSFLYSDCYRLVRSFANWSLPPLCPPVFKFGGKRFANHVCSSEISWDFP